MGLSIRAYAAHRGVSHTSVRKAIASGRLTIEADGSIDRDKADRAWVRNADPSKTQNSTTLKPVPEAAVGTVRDTLSEAGTPLVGGMSYLHAKTAEKVLTVQLLREKLRREKGEVVERDYAIEQGFSFARRIRDQWLGWPARVSALMAADLGVDTHSPNCEKRLARLVQEMPLAAALLAFHHHDPIDIRALIGIELQTRCIFHIAVIIRE